MGSGDGDYSLLRAPLVFIKNIALSSRNTKYASNGILTYSDSASTASLRRKIKIFSQTIFRYLWALTIAYEKRRKLEGLTRYKAQGGIIVCDRYPQSQLKGINDGPLLSTGKSRNLSIFENWEQDSYKLKNASRFDIVIKLVGDIEVIKTRRPEMEIEYIDRKQNAIYALDLTPSYKEVVIDTTELSPDLVYRKIMGTLQEYISTESS